jgi:hypothetical protein
MKDSSIWYLQYQGAEHGPFSMIELENMLGARKFVDRIHLWRPGLSHWLPVRMDALAGNTPSLFLRNELIAYERDESLRKSATESANAAGVMRRKFARRGLVAIVFAIAPGGRRSYLGVSLDFSERGIGIRLERPSEFPAGTRLSLEVHPLSLTGLGPFRVAGEVKWSGAHRLGIELTDYAQAERAMALLELEKIARMLAPESPLVP